MLALTALIYVPGLPGPFLFDDKAHVSENSRVRIPDLSLESLKAAWHSSFAPGLAGRSLAQLTFGINHALAGLDSRYYKVTNLGIHLLNGLLVFALAGQLARAIAQRRDHPPPGNLSWLPLLTAAIWLLHPLNLTPVLYVVQRMTSLSALFVLAGLWCHVTGRLQMAAGRGAGFWLALAGLPIALVGVLAKESAALYPLLVLVLEWTLLRELRGGRRALLTVLSGILPVVVGLAYLLSHLEILNYDGRNFTLEERLLTEARIVWIYVRMLIIPDLSSLAFYHDDIALSTDLATPWTTLPAVATWLLVVGAAMWLARRWPVASFAALFFVAGHAMESTVFALELMFEHRNYLPSLSIVFAIAYGALSLAAHKPMPRLLPLTVLVYIGLLSVTTHLRAWDWSSEESLILREVERHPDSVRANFDAARILISSLDRTSDRATVYAAARQHLEHARQLAPDNLDALFGLVVLNLHVERQPEPQWLEDLIYGLQFGGVDPTRLTTAQFSYLARWHMAGAYSLPPQTVIRIFEAILANQRLDRYARAGILSAFRAYYVAVLGNAEQGLVYGRQAVQYWPERWHYHQRLVELLVQLGRFEDAQNALDAALEYDPAGVHRASAAELDNLIRSARAPTEGTIGQAAPAPQ